MKDSSITVRQVFESVSTLPWIKISVDEEVVVDEDSIMSITELEEAVESFLEKYGDEKVDTFSAEVVQFHHFALNFTLIK